MMITLYAKKEPTIDPVSFTHGLKLRNDTVVYKDQACTRAAGRWPWYQSLCPRRGQKTAVLNCFRWKLEWVNDSQESNQ